MAIANSYVELPECTSTIIEQHCQDFTCLGPGVSRDTMPQGRTVKEQLDKFVADAHHRGDVYIIVPRA